MKIFLQLLVFVIFFSCESTNKKETTFVFDKENILNEDQESRLNDLFREHEKRTTNEIIVVTTPDWDGKKNALFYAVDFGNDLGVGKPEKDNGIVIVFSNQQKEVRISTGYGTEQVLKDEIVKNFIDSLMFPKFKEGQYFEGLYSGSMAVVEFLERPENEIKAKKSKPY